MDKRIAIIASLFVILAIGMGAFGAHALKPLLVELGKETSFNTATRYLFYGAISLFVFILSGGKLINNYKWPAWLLIVGAVFFSFSIYGLIFIKSDFKSMLGPITPIGGLLMIIAWILYLVKLILKK